MRLIYFLLIGLCAGWLAGKLTKGRGFGWLGNLIIGVVGAIVGGLLFGLVGFTATSLLAELIMATVGAVVLLALLQYAQKSPKRRRR